MKPTANLAVTALMLAAQPPSAWRADRGDGTFQNPLLWGDWPDPDVIRVDDTFYLVSTSMHYVPGCPILRSKDLVNWEMAGHAVTRYDEDPRYDMKGGILYLNGSWAATLRHHGGTFYVGFCTPYGLGTDKGHFSLCTAKDVRGPWKRTVFPEYLYDPGLFFDDDGRIYVVHGQDTLYLTELNATATAVKGPARKLFQHRGYPYLEGSHVYKIQGRYYILASTGGTQGRQVCLRSDRIEGPYEHKVILDDDHTYPGNGLHQGGLVQLQNGDWWAILMQDRGPIGRTPNLEPVTWVDGWPMLGRGGKGVDTAPKPAVGAAFLPGEPAASDAFTTPRLGLQWQWNHNPDDRQWSLTERPGHLRLRAGRATDLTTARNTLTQRVQGPASEATVELDAQDLRDGDVASFGVFQKPYAVLAVRQDKGQRRLQWMRDGQVEATLDPLPSPRIWLRAAVTHVGFEARLSYSLDGRTFVPFGPPLKMDLGYDWTANRFAIFAYHTGPAQVGGTADFRDFRFQGKP